MPGFRAGIARRNIKSTVEAPGGFGSASKGAEVKLVHVNVYIPTPFRSFTGNRTNVEVEGSNISELLSNLDARFPGFRHLCTDESGAIPRHINIYVNNKEIGSLNGPATMLNDGDQVAVIPAMAGGAPGDSNGGPVVLTADQVTRYSRHIIMPQVGSTGQRQIMAAKVLVIGAGGLGS